MSDSTKFPLKRILIGSFICLIGALFYCYEFVLRIVPGILQSELISSFGNISATTFGNLSALYYFAYSPMQLPVGILMDRFGPRKLLTLACLCCALGSLLFSFPSSIIIAGIGRFLVGFGSAFAFVGVLSCAIHWLPYRFFSLVAGLMTTIGMLGIIYGGIKLTQLSHHMSLEHILLLLVVIGFGMAIALFVVIRDNPEPTASQKTPWSDFLRNVIIVLKSPKIWLIGIIAACLYTSLSVFGELWGKAYLESAHHLSKIQAAESISWMFMGWAVGAPAAGFISDKFKNRSLPLLCGAIIAFICISIILFKSGLAHTTLNLLLFIYGLFSSAEIVAFIMANEAITQVMPGTIFAVINLIVTMGGAIFQPLVGILLDLSSGGKTIANSHVYNIQDYRFALSLIPILLIISTISLFYLRKKYK